MPVETALTGPRPSSQDAAVKPTIPGVEIFHRCWLVQHEGSTGIFAVKVLSHFTAVIESYYDRLLRKRMVKLSVSSISTVLQLYRRAG